MTPSACERACNDNRINNSNNNKRWLAHLFNSLACTGTLALEPTPQVRTRISLSLSIRVPMNICMSMHCSAPDVRRCECTCACSLCVPGMSVAMLNTPPPIQICFAPDELQNGHKDATSVTMHDLISTKHGTHRNYTPGPGVQHSATHPRAAAILHLKTRSRLRFPTALAVPGTSQI